MDLKLEKTFRDILARKSEEFGQELDLKGLLFLIGVQELGQGPQHFKKDDKVNLMHIAICTLLEPYGYYVYEGVDQEGWPHFEVNSKLPPLTSEQQEYLIKEAVVEYFEPGEH